MDIIQDNIELLLLILLLFSLIMLVAVIILIIQQSKMRRKYAQMMKGKQIVDFESTVINIQNELKQLKTVEQEQDKQMEDVKEKLKYMKANLGILRYNAFAQQGNDLSFSLAILDDQMSGVVLTGLHNREDSYIYAKSIEKGQSKYALSPEEKAVIDQALEK